MLSLSCLSLFSCFSVGHRSYGVHRAGGFPRTCKFFVCRGGHAIKCYGKCYGDKSSVAVSVRSGSRPCPERGEPGSRCDGIWRGWPGSG